MDFLHGRGLQSQTSHWLVTLTISVPYVYPEQIVCQTFCVCVSVLLPPLKDLPGYRRWPLQAQYSPLLGVFARVTLVNS